MHTRVGCTRERQPALVRVQRQRVELTEDRHRALDRRIDELVDSRVGDTHVPAQASAMADLREAVVLLLGVAAKACGEV